MFTGFYFKMVIMENLNLFAINSLASTYVSKLTSLDLQTLSEIVSYANNLEKKLIEVTPWSDKALERFVSCSIEQKQELLRYYQTQNKILSSLNELPESEPLTKLDQEIYCASLALKDSGLIIDDSFWKTVEEEDLIEIYNLEMKQIYRSFSFFKISGYSLLDISIQEWYVLYERPQKIIDLMYEDVNHTIKNSIGLHKFKVPTHVLRENFNTGNTYEFEPRACIVDFKYIGCLKRSITQEVRGFICTSKAECIATGQESLNIGFV